MKYKIKFIITLIILSFCTQIVTAGEIGCGNENGEKRYDCQIKNNCDIYKPKNFHFETEKYFFPKKIENGKKDISKEERKIEKNNANKFKDGYNSNNLLENGKKLYVENQNSIYTCALIDIQRNTLKIVKEKLTPINKNGDLKSIIDKKIELKLNKIKLIEKQKKCISPTNQEKKDNVLNPKQQILNESAYEFCKYNYYLDFLKNHYKEIENINNNVLDKTKTDKYRVSEIAKNQNRIQQNILDEEEHSAKVFNMAFETYIDYENNYPVHILLEIIKEDFKILRRKFHEAISPLNQVVYKISNAMSIH